ncbi:Uu.00g116830.m01.CDS01 [Anthostomella pinea]|uniref:Uu.00g116830.m01.CDS01 n=1 Tax=Anthostomella pinea TaxID=933095 RepID=A0AAI8YGV5_9PEZI|nr:Uu.00g116830.m01.CDS01 [Anthostomella pinea]
MVYLVRALALLALPAGLLAEGKAYRRDTTSSVTTTVTAGALPTGFAKIASTIEEPTVVEGAYVVVFQDDKSYKATGSKTTLRKKFSADLLNGVSIHLQSNGSSEDAQAVIAQLPEVRAAEPVRIYALPKINVVASATNSSEILSLLDKRQRPTENNSSSTHLSTQVTQLRDLGYTGKGVKIAIIDAPVDYNHPALGGCFGEGCFGEGCFGEGCFGEGCFGEGCFGEGCFGEGCFGEGCFGEGCLVSFGRDCLEPVDVDNTDPSCKSHATALAGVIAAQENAVGFTGVAPGVQLGSYGISGCTVGGDDEKLLAALQQAVDDNVHIVVYSLGFGNGWTNLALNLAFDNMAAKGIMIVVAAGNDGGSGIFHTASGADATDAFGVGSVDGDQDIAFANITTYTATAVGGSVSFDWRDGESPNNAGWGNIVLPLWTNLDADACQPLPDDTPDLSERIVLLRRGGCSDDDIATTAGEKNAKYVIYSDTDAGLRIEVPRVTETSLLALAMVDVATGASWFQLLQSGADVVVNMTTTANGPQRQLVSDAYHGGRMSSFSQWGPTFDGYLATQVSAPGTSILTTAPVEEGKSLYVITAGTSVAGPFAAGVAALVAEARQTQDRKVLSSLLATTAKPLVRATPSDDWDTPGNELASVAQQGGGLVQAYNAAFAPSVISVNTLQFNNTEHRTTLSFTITNESPDAITYDLSNIPAGTVYTFTETDLKTPADYDDITNTLYTKDAATLQFMPGAQVTVPGNRGSVEVEVVASEPPNANLTRLPVWSGYIALNGTDGFDYTLPYMGIGGSLDDTPALNTLTWRLTDPNAGPGEEPRPVIEPGRIVNMPAEQPILQVSIGMGLRTVAWDVVSADSGAVLGPTGIPSFERATRANYLVTWDGKFQNGTQVPAGAVKVVAKSLKTFGSEENEDDWLSLESAELDIAWSS